MQNKIKGKQGEKLALKYLLNNNYKILDTNFHYWKMAEIDIEEIKRKNLKRLQTV